MSNTAVNISDESGDEPIVKRPAPQVVVLPQPPARTISTASTPQTPKRRPANEPSPVSSVLSTLMRTPTTPAASVSGKISHAIQSRLALKLFN